MERIRTEWLKGMHVCVSVVVSVGHAYVCMCMQDATVQVHSVYT